MKQYQNILIVRTDRIGDVILTTPAVAALREVYPQARISMMISPATKELLEGNPYLNDVIVDETKNKQNHFIGLCKFVLALKKRKFDLAIIFHTKNRTNLLCFLAGIPNRIGYENEKLGFLLTHKIEDTRAQGFKHETQYCLDVLREIGVKSECADLYVPIKRESDEWTQQFFNDHCVQPSERLIAIHPGASCVSKRWPAKRFIEITTKLITCFSFKVVIIGAMADKEIAGEIISSVQGSVIDATGKTSLSQLISLLKKCDLLISNDSGPVHIASALGIAVISIFGRNQAGLSPVRWGPLGEKSIALHKDVGCKVCLAHNCQIGFRCLEAIKSEDMLDAVESILASGDSF